jgi:hypothetical protein
VGARTQTRGCVELFQVQDGSYVDQSGGNGA